MTKPTIVLTHRFFPEIIERELKPHAHVIVAPTRAALERAIARADGLITRFSDPVDEKLLARAPRLRVVANYAVGYDNIDCRACARRGVRVTNTPEVLTRATAELAATLLMAAARRVPEGEALCRQGRFKGWDPQMLIGLELRGRHAVLVGPGRIGKETATIFKGLGLKVSWITRKDTDQEILKKLSKAQVLSLHVPLTKETRHWLNAKRIAALPKDAIVINTTR
ncbi:MAG: NAD(P)-dependent oxidoreductase, partial [Bdellovibrionota bacterium]